MSQSYWHRGLTAELKKQQYVYYHCTGYKGKCPEKYVRQEEIARRFGEAIKAIQLDREVLDWIKTAPKGSHEAEERHHREALASLQDQYDKIQKRLDALYVDKLDGEIAREFYEQKSSQRRREHSQTLLSIGRLGLLCSANRPGTLNGYVAHVLVQQGDCRTGCWVSGQWGCVMRGSGSWWIRLPNSAAGSIPGSIPQGPLRVGSSWM